MNKNTKKNNLQLINNSELLYLSGQRFVTGSISQEANLLITDFLNTSFKDTIWPSMPGIDLNTDSLKNQYQDVIYNLIIKITEEYFKICNISLKGELNIDQVWYVCMKENQFLKLHHHDECIVSGAIYLDVSENAISHSTFPEGAIEYVPMANTNRTIIENEHRNCIIPKTNMFNIWPSWIKHTIYPWKNPGTRKLISFNISCTNFGSQHYDYYPWTKK